MATVSVPLIHGLTTVPVDGGDPVVHTDAEIREATVGDLLDATEAAERAVMTPEGYRLLTSPTRLGAELIARQVVKIGSVEGPLTLGQLKRLHPDDLDQLQAAADRLGTAADRALQGVAAKGES